MGIVTDINIIQNDGILDIAVIADIGFLEDHGILNRAVYDRTA